MENQITISEIMASRLITFKTNDSLSHAISVLLQNKISGGPVLDEQGNLVGMLSEKDCLKPLTNSAYHDMMASRVGDLMHSPVETVEDNLDIISLAEKFLKLRYRRIAVTRNGKLVGQVSRRDVLKAMEKMAKKKIPSLSGLGK